MREQRLNHVRGSSRHLYQEEKFRKAQFPTLARMQAELEDKVYEFERAWNRAFVYQGEELDLEADILRRKVGVFSSP